MRVGDWGVCSRFVVVVVVVFVNGENGWDEYPMMSMSLS